MKDMEKDMMKMDENMIYEVSDQELEQTAGGAVRPYHQYSTSSRWKTVKGLKSGYLAMRTQRCYDYRNEMRGCELYNGDKVKLVEKAVTGSDGRKYAKVYSPKHNATGYVNADYLK